MASTITVSTAKENIAFVIDRTEQTSIPVGDFSIPVSAFSHTIGDTATDVLVIKNDLTGVSYKLDLALGSITVNAAPAAANNKAMLAEILALI